MTDQTSKPDDREPVSENAEVDKEVDDAAIWAELNAEDNQTADEPPLKEERLPGDQVDEADGQDDRTDEVEDKWVNVDPELRQSYEASQAEVDRLKHRVSSEVGRVAASQRRISQLQKQIQQPSEVEAERQSASKLETLAEDYPEVAGPVSAAFQDMESRMERLNNAERARSQEAQEELNSIIEGETNVLAQTHPDWQDTLKANGQAFLQWAEDQPRHMREAVQRNENSIVDGQAAIEVVGAFKHHLTALQKPAPSTSPQNSRRDRQLAGSSSPSRSGRAGSIADIPEEGDTGSMWNEMERRDAQKRR